jgi:hypothetical protein
MVSDSEIVFVTTALYTKWLDYQKNIIKKLFPESTHIIVDGRKLQEWPKSWFYWIDHIKQTQYKWYVLIDEDCFLSNREELINVINKMNNEDINIMGCSDGYYEQRNYNPIAMNPFLMIGRISDIDRIQIDMKSFRFKLNTLRTGVGKLLYYWTNNSGVKFKQEYKDTFIYPHKIKGVANFLDGAEPYYFFFWYMKEIGCKFEYLYPHLDEYYNSTNPRISENSNDIAIHMWETRNCDSDTNFLGLSNKERWSRIKKYMDNKYDTSFTIK